MKKTMTAIMALLFCLSIAIARYVKSTFTPFPALSQLDEYTVNLTDSYNHLFDLQSKTLNELLASADAVVLAEAIDDGNYAALSLRRRIHVNECIKGKTEDEVTYYDPVIIGADNQIGLQFGYLPMIKGHEYLLFLREKPHLEGDDIEYYPLACDLGKFEYGKKSFIHDGDIRYGQVKNDAICLQDRQSIFVDGLERNEIYNQVYDEIIERGLFK